LRASAQTKSLFRNPGKPGRRSIDGAPHFIPTRIAAAIPPPHNKE
jgi:hypothetical protein